MADYFLKKIPDDLWKEFRHLCIDKDKTMRKRLIELIKQDIEKKEKGNDI